MYVAQVELGGAEATIVWDNGTLSGEPFTVAIVELELEAKVIYGPEGQYWTGKDRYSGNAVWWTLQDMFDGVTLLSGELPESPAIPQGATG